MAEAKDIKEEAQTSEDTNKKAIQATEAKLKKKMPKALKIVLVGVAGFVGFIIVMVVIFFMASSGATKASDEFLNALQAGDGATAYSLFSSEAKEIVPEDEFAVAVEQIGPVLNAEEKKISTNVSAETGSDTEAVVAYEIDGTDGKTYVFAVTLVKEDDQWKVQRFDSDEKTAEK